MNGGDEVSESMLVCAIMRELGKHGAVYRTNAGQFYTKRGQRVSGLPKGFSDVTLVLPGGAVCFIEAKVKPNKPTPEQLAFIGKMRRLGCRAGVAYTVDEAVEICGLPARDNSISRQLPR